MNHSTLIRKSGERRIFKTAMMILSAVLISFTLTVCSDNPTDTGIGNGHGNGNGNGANEPGPNEVFMVGQSFTPSSLEIDVGTTIRWENKSSEIHTVTSGTGGSHDGEFDSGDIAPGGEYSYTFNEVGEFNYFCIPHPNMTGIITVVD